MAMKKEKIQIVPDAKILIELERFADSESKSVLSLGSYIEEVLGDNLLLIKMPIHRGYNYPLPRNKPINAYFFMHSRMFSLSFLFLECVERDNLGYAKVRVLGDLQPGQRRDCFRLQECDMPVLVKREHKDGPMMPAYCEIINFSDGGMLIATNEEMTVGEAITLAFDIGTIETIKAEVLRIEAPFGLYNHSIAVRFLHTCKKQKSRFYVFIIQQQRERLRQQSEADSENLD